MVKVLFVCMGNICRSPTAEGMFRHQLRLRDLHERVWVDSAGTHAYHVGSPPDPRARRAALGRGIDLGDQRARQVQAEDFEAFDYILAMDEDNLAHLESLCPSEHRAKLSLLLSYAPHLGIREVPDPYYGGNAGFERVLDMIEAACEGLLQAIAERHFSQRERVV